MVERFLPLATYYTSTHAFVEQYSVLEHGVINHALCAAIREMLKVSRVRLSSCTLADPRAARQEYLTLIAKLEHLFLNDPLFTLQLLWFNLHPHLHTLSLIHSLTADLVSLDLPREEEEEVSSDDSTEDGFGGGEAMRGILEEMKGAAAGIKSANDKWQGGIAKGGEVLYVLTDKLERTSGDPAARELYGALLLRASQPYAVILLGWISTGHLSDPWDEFIVKEGKGINRGSLEMDYTDEYWERRYTLRDKGAKKSAAGAREPPRARGLAGGSIVPSFLEPWKNKILLAGKYLNVIRECGIEIAMPEGGSSDELVAINEPR